MELKVQKCKPPLSKSNKSVQDILKIHSPTGSEKLPPLMFRVKKKSSTPRSFGSIQIDSPSNALKLETLYEKIQSFESPVSLKTHRYTSSFSPKSESVNKSVFKTPSPKYKQETVFSDWDIKQALEAPRPRNLREKRKILIGSLKSY